MVYIELKLLKNQNSESMILYCQVKLKIDNLYDAYRVFFMFTKNKVSDKLVIIDRSGVGCYVKKDMMRRYLII